MFHAHTEIIVAIKWKNDGNPLLKMCIYKWYKV